MASTHLASFYGLLHTTVQSEKPSPTPSAPSGDRRLSFPAPVQQRHYDQQRDDQNGSSGLIE
jgi:hypothetical protein